MSIDLRLKPTKIFDDVYAVPEQEDVDEISKWHCKEGFVKSILQINKEFN
jgi:hypothetical protein